VQTRRPANQARKDSERPKRRSATSVSAPLTAEHEATHTANGLIFGAADLGTSFATFCFCSLAFFLLSLAAYLMLRRRFRQARTLWTDLISPRNGQCEDARHGRTSPPYVGTRSRRIPKHTANDP
jgi:hypothetical protein